MNATREPFDRRRMRLIQTMLAFPAAGIIGFGGSAIVRGMLSEDTSVASPITPGHTTDETPTPREREAPQPSDDSNSVGLV
jgi:hypothetical protein